MLPIRTPSIRFGHRFVLAILCAAAGWVLTGGVLAQGLAGPQLIERINGHDAVAGEVIVKYFAAKSAGERAQTDPTQTTYTDTTAVSGTTSYYVVVAVNNNGVQSAPSSEAFATAQYVRNSNAACARTQ